MKYEDIKKMGEAYAQVQEKMRLENVKRAEAMVQAEAKKIEKEMSDMEKTRAMAMNPPKKDKQDTKNRPNPEMRGEEKVPKGYHKMPDGSIMKNSDMKKKEKIDEKGPKVVKKDVSVKGIAKASDQYRANLKNATEGAKQGEPIKGTIGKPKKVGMKDDASNDKSDDGDGMDKVSSKSAKKKFGDRKDKDIDNDGDVDSSDEYLHKRRKAISKNSESKGKKEVEVQTQEKVKEAASTGAGKNSDSVAQDKTDGMSPNAKKELARATNEPAVDAEKSNKLNFATFKKMTKKSKDN